MQKRLLTRVRAVHIWLMAPLLGLSVFLVVLVSGTAPVALAITSDSNLNFQARLLTNTGSVVPDGNYNIDFKIYNADGTTGTVGTCTGACLWEESRLVASSQGVSVINGYFSVNLGSVNAFASTINWDQQLYLTMNVTTNGTVSCTPATSCTWNGEMQNSGHSIALTAVPLAFKANQLQINNGTQTGTLKFNTVANSPIITLPDETGTVCTSAATSTANCTNFAPSSGSGNYIQNQVASLQAANFRIQSSANGNVGGTIEGAAGQTADLFDLINGASGSTVLSIGAAGATLHKVSTDSANAFQIQNSTGGNLFNVDSTNSNTNNKVANPSFESAISNWSAVGTGAASQSSAQAYEGTKSLLITSGTTEGGASYSTGATTFLSTNTTYTLSAFLKTDSSTPIHVDIGDEELTGTLIPCLTNQLLPENGGWTRFTCTWTTSGTTPTNSFIYFKQTSTDPAATKNIYVDDVVLQTDAQAQNIYRNGAISFSGAMVASPLVLQNATNSTNALQVNNAAGTQIFNVDTTDSNLISNPGFEVNLAGTAGTGWTAAANTTIRRDTTQAYTGVASLKVNIAGATTGGAQFNLNPVVTAASTTYTISWYSILGSGAAPTFQATYDPTGAAPTTCNPSGTDVTGGWTRFSCTVSSATTPTTGGFIKIAQTNTAVSAWYIDGVQMEAASAASAYGAGGISLNATIATPVVLVGKSNSVNAFQIQNANGADTLLTADTVNNRVTIGNGDNTSAANSTLLVVDNGSTANRPTAVNGGIFYDSTLGHFVVVENVSGTPTYKVLCNQTDAACGSGGSSTTTLQQAYNNSSSPAQIITTATAKTIQFIAGSTFDSAGLFQVQNAAGNSVLSVDTSSTAANNVVTLGRSNGASGLTGKLSFANSANNNTFILQAGATGSNLTYTLPTADAGAGNVACLQTTGGTGVLSFGDCSGTGGGGAGNANRQLSNLASVAVNASLVPGSANAIDLGSATLPWRDLYVAGSISTAKGTDYSTISGNNVNFGDVSLVRLTGASSQTITGIANGRDGYILNIINASGFTATIANLSGSSLAANQITTGTGAAYNLVNGASIQLIYDATASLWRMAGSGSAGTSTTTLNQAYANGSTSANQTLNLTSADGGGVLIQDAASTVGTLFAVQSNAGSTSYLSVNNTTVAITDALTVSSTINTDTLDATHLTFSGASPTITTSSSGSALTVQGNGAGALNLNSATTGAVNLGNTTGVVTVEGSSAAAGIAIGNSNNVHGIQIGAGGTSTAQTIVIGSTGSTSAVTIEGSNTGINIGNGTTAHTINIGSGNLTAASSTINIGGGTTTTSGSKTLNLGTGAPGTGTTNAIHIGDGGTTSAGTVGVTIGSIAAAAHTTTLQAGVNGTNETLQLQVASAGFIGVGTSAATKTIDIGSVGTTIGASTVNIATTSDATTIQNIKIGSTANASDTITLQGGSTLGVLVKPAVGTAALQVQNATNPVFTVDTSGNQVVLGKSATLGGVLQFNTAGAGAITINTASTGTGYTLTLPTAGPGTSQCLQTDSVTASQLKFAACASGITLQTAYNASPGTTTPEIILNSGGDAAGVDIQNNNASPVTGSLFAVRDKTASGLGTAMFSIDNNGLITLQPAASLTNGQDEVTQTLTAANATVSGVIRGYVQNITISNSTAGSTSGISITETDNTSLANTNQGIGINLTGTNTSQNQIALNAQANHGIAIQGTSTGIAGTGGCGGFTAQGVGVCGVSNGGSTAIFAEFDNGTISSSITDPAASALYARNLTGGFSGDYAVGIRSLSRQSVAGTNSIGIYADAGNSSGSSTLYGGYFTLQNSGNTGSGIYVDNGSNSGASVATFKSTSNMTTAFQIQNSSAASLLNGDTTNMRIGVDITYTAMSTPAAPTATLPNQAAITSVVPTGGSATSYTYEVVAVVAGTGNSSASATVTNAAGAATLNSTAFNTVNITAFTGATYYMVYRTASGATAGSSSASTGLIGTTTTTTFVDNGGWAGSSAPTAGGSLAAGTYRYKISAIDSVGGETAVSAESGAITTVAGKLTGDLSWTAVTGASGYKIYRTTGTTGTSNSEVYLTTVTGQTPSGTTMTFTDTGSISLGSATPPTTTTAYISASTSNSLAQLSVGGLGTPTGQVYVSGTLPKDVTAGGVATKTTPTDVVVQGRYAYIVNSVSNKLQVFDVSNPAAPVDISGGGVTTASGPFSLFVQGHYAYVIDQTVNKLQVFDITNPSEPVDVSGGGATTSSGAQSIYVQGRYAYVADNTSPTGLLQVFDVSNPAKPVDVTGGGVTAGNRPYYVYVQGRYAYLVDTTSAKLQVFDVSNPASPVDVSHGGVSTGSFPQTVFVQGRYAYVADEGAGKLQVFDVSNPAAPVDVSGGGVTTNGFPDSVIVQGRYAYTVNDTANKIQVFDISNPAKPADVSSGGVSTGNIDSVSSNPLFVSGRYAYVLNGNDSTFQIFDLGGTYSQQLEAGGTETGTLQVDSNSQFAGDVNIQGGTSIGQALQVNDDIGVGGNAYIQGTGSFNVAYSVMSAPSGATAAVQTQATAPTVTPTGGVSTATRWDYEVVALKNGIYWSTISNAGTTSVGYSTLNDTQYNALSWTAVSGASSYQIFRTFAGGTPGSTGLIGTATSNSFNDRGYAGNGNSSPTGNGILSATTTYFYKITAIDGAGGETLPSSEVSAATGGTIKKINLSWTAVTGATGYKIYRSTTTGTETYLNVSRTNAYMDGDGFRATGSASPPSTGTAHTAANNSNNLLQLSVGGNGEPTGQLYVSGTIPSAATSSLYYNLSSGSDGVPYDITVQGNYAYLPMHAGYLSIVDISNPKIPIETGDVGIFNAPNNVAVSGRYAFVTSGNGACSGTCQLSVVDVSNPGNPQILTQVSTGNSSDPADIAVQGKYVYIVNNGSDTLGIWDVSTPANPVNVNNVALQHINSSGSSLFIQGNYAYIGDSSGWLEAVDISNPLSAFAVSGSAVVLAAGGYGVYVQGEYAYVADNNGTLDIFDYSNVTAPRLISTVATRSSGTPLPESVFIQGRYAYVGNFGTGDVAVIDVTVPGQPVLMGNIPTDSSPYTLYVQGRYLYVANAYSPGSMQIFDLGGAYLQALQAGSTELSTLAVDSNSMFAGNVSIQGGTSIGQSLNVGGNLTASGTSVAFTNTGDIQPWKTTTAFAGIHANNTSCVVNGYIYNFDSSGTSQYAKLNSDGSVGAWTTLTAQQTNGDSASCVTAGGYIYEIGGHPSGVVTTVSYARPGSNGNISAWNTTTSLPNARDFAGAVYYNGYLYEVGGFDGTNAQNTVYYAKTNADGTLGSWQSGTTFTTAVHDLNVAAANGYLYKFGGDTTGGANQTTVEHAPINADGSIGSWTSVGDSALPVANRGMGVAVMNGNVYIYGGSIATSAFSANTYYAKLNSDGTVGSWNTATNNMSTALAWFGFASANGYMYALGGCNGTGCNTGNTTVQYTSTNRVLIGGSLDLVGQSGQTLTGEGLGGSITAGDITAVGNLQIQGTGSFAQGVAISGSLSVGGPLYVSGTTPVTTIGTVAVTGATPDPQGIYVQGNYAYIVNNNTSTIQAYDVSNAASPAAIGSPVSTGSGPYAITVQGHYAYVVTSTAGKLEVYNIFNPFAITSVGSATAGTNPQGVYVQGRYAYVVNNGSNTLQIFDISNPATPQSVGSVSTATGAPAPWDVYVQGSIAYVGGNTNGDLATFNVSNPASPTFLAHVNAGSGSAHMKVVVKGRYAYTVNNGDGTLRVYDVSNPSSLSASVGSISLSNSTGPSLYIQGHYAYVGDNAGFIKIVDISSPTNPVLAGSITTTTTTLQTGIYVKGRYAYEVGNNNLLAIYDIGGGYIQQLEAGGAEFGTLQADSNAQFAADVNIQGGASIGQSLQVNGNVAITSTATGGSVLSINSSANNINLLDVKDLNTNFGSAVTAGAFISRQSYWGDDFNVNRASTAGLTATTHTAQCRGDYGSSFTSGTCTAGTGELSIDTLMGGTSGATCTYSSQNALNGNERISAVGSATANTKGDCLEYLGTPTAQTANNLFNASNLPVAVFKIRPSNVTNANARVYVGLASSGATTAAADSMPASGLFVSNCSTYGTGASVPTCPAAGGNWYAYAANSSTGTNNVSSVQCTNGNIDPGNYAYFRIEVRSSSEVHFYYDTATNNGIVEAECGSGITTNIPTSSLTTWIQANVSGNSAVTENLDVDYFHVWQDDNATPPQTQSDTTATAPDGSQLITEAPVTPDPNQPDPNIAGSFFNFLGATSEDTVINGNLFVHGTIYADKIKANQIEGLSVFTDQLASLQQELNNTTASSTTPTSGGTNTTTIIETATTSLNLNDGLTVGGDANFHGNAFFYKLVTFVEKTVFNNDVSFNAHITTGGDTPTDTLETAAGITTTPVDNPNAALATATLNGNDNSGQLTVNTGDNPASGKLITVNFKKVFDKAPQIFLTPTNDQTASLHYYVQSTPNGFAIYVIDPLNSGQNLSFNYWVVQ